MEQFREERSVKGDFVPGDVDDDYAESERFEIVLVLESPIGGYECVTFQVLNQDMVFQVLPA